MDLLVGRVVVQIVVADHADDVAQRSLGASRIVEQEVDVPLGRLDQAGGVAARRDHVGSTVVRQDAARLAARRSSARFARWAGSRAALVDVRHRVLQRVAAEEQLPLRPPERQSRRRCGSRWNELEPCRPSRARAGRRMSSVGRTSGSIGGGPSSVPRSIASRDARRSSAVRAQREHRRVPERCRPCDVVEMPVAEDDGEVLAPSSSSNFTDAACMLDRDVRVVDQRGVTRDDRVARDPQRERAVVHPVRPGVESIAVHAAVVERVHAGAGRRTRS